MRLAVLLASTILVALPSKAVLAQSARATSDGSKHSAAAAFEEGQNAQQRGDLNSAVKFYSTAIAADATLFQAYYQRAVAFVGLGRGAEAFADLQKVIELEPGFARGHRAMGQLLLDRDKVDEAKRELAKAVELDPKLTGVRIYYASVLLRTGEPQAAIEHLRVAIDQKEELPLAYALVGVAEERTGKLTEAFADYSKGIELDANNATAHEGRGRLLEGRNEFSRAIEDYSIAYRYQPSRELAIKLAELHTRVGQKQAAVQLYRKMLLEKPEDLVMRVEMACLMSDNDQGEEAGKEIVRVLAAKPTNPKLLARIGDFYFKEKAAQAVDFYRRSLEGDPSDNRVRVQLGAALVRSMQIEAALPILSEAMAKEPDNYAAHASLATAMFKLKQFPEAAREFVWIIKVRPEVAASYYFLAISLDHLGDCEQADRAYREFVRRGDPSTNKSEIDEAIARSGQLQRLIKEKKCAAPARKKTK